jgi:DNA-binding NarL/FixJ family response regulator
MTDRERGCGARGAGHDKSRDASALFLAEKTVENHVGRILQKLDISSRTRLATYASSTD